MQLSSATQSLHLSFGGLRKIVACSHSSQRLLVSTVFGTVSSLHPTSFLMIFILVILTIAVRRFTKNTFTLISRTMSCSQYCLGVGGGRRVSTIPGPILPASICTVPIAIAVWGPLRPFGETYNLVYLPVSLGRITCTGNWAHACEEVYVFQGRCAYMYLDNPVLSIAP